MPDTPDPPHEPPAWDPPGEPQAAVGEPEQDLAAAETFAPPRRAATAPVLPDRRPSAGRGAWVLVALVCVLAGLVTSFLVARSTARSDAASARHSFARATATVAATLKPALAHGEDLLTSAGTYYAHNSVGSPTEFHVWARWAQVLRDHPELQSLSLLSLVRASELADFRTRVPADAKNFKITPPGASSYHCLTLTAVADGPAASPSHGVDYCALNPALLPTRDSAATIYGTVALTRGEGLEVLTPVYRGDAVPKSDYGRRAAFVGWLREVLDPSPLLAGAHAAAPGLAIRLRHETPGSTAIFTTGRPPAGALTATAKLQNGWTLRSFAPAPSAAISANGDAETALLAGILLSLLFGGVALLLLRPGRSAPKQPVPVKAVLHEELYDRLTGLPNRALTLDRAERMLARAGRQSGVMVGALFIDIDWFKDVNDKLGTEAGDKLLRIVAERLNGVIRTHDTVGRHGGDEFVVLVESAARGMRLDSLARRIIESLHKPIELEGFGPSFCVTASIGVAFGRYATPEDLLRDAHMALFAAKAAGKDRYTLFNANMRSIIEGRGVLEVDLNRALAEDQFTLLYQPIFDLGTQGVVAVESLLRWEHPVKGDIPPDDFIPLAEDSGLIVPIGRWVLEHACEAAAAWNVAEGHRVAVAVKVSANQLNRDGFVTDVRRALQQSGLEPDLLIVEIAETTVMLDATGMTRRLLELRELGVRIAVDDFGSGFAYRADLQRMPIDFLKVDRSSLAASEDEDYRSWLLEAILVFGRDLSLTVIAKGVETQDQLTALKEMGCKMAQGYFLGEPAPSTTVERLLGMHIAPVASTEPPQSAAPTYDTQVKLIEPEKPLANPAPAAATGPIPAGNAGVAPAAEPPQKA